MKIVDRPIPVYFTGLSIRRIEEFDPDEITFTKDQKGGYYFFSMGKYLGDPPSFCRSKPKHMEYTYFIGPIVIDLKNRKNTDPQEVNIPDIPDLVL